MPASARVPASHWRTLLGSADRVARHLAAVYTRACLRARLAGSTPAARAALERAVESGSVSAIQSALPWAVYWQALQDGLEPVLLDAIVAGAQLSLPNIDASRRAAGRQARVTKRTVLVTKKDPESGGRGTRTIRPPTGAAASGGYVALRTRFDRTNPYAIAWAMRHAGELITRPADRDAIRALIVEALRSGRTVRDISREILACVGMGTQQVASLRAWMAAQAARLKPGQTIDPAKIQRKTDALLRQRAHFIALNESLVAAKQGNQIGIESSFASGDLLPGRYLKQWVLTPDDKLCPICRSQRNPDGTLLTVAVDQPWTLQAKGITLGMIPHAHPRCRCVQALIPDPAWVPTPGREITSLLSNIPAVPTQAPTPPPATTRSPAQRTAPDITMYVLTGNTRPIRETLRARGWTYWGSVRGWVRATLAGEPTGGHYRGCLLSRVDARGTDRETWTEIRRR